MGVTYQSVDMSHHTMCQYVDTYRTDGQSVHQYGPVRQTMSSIINVIIKYELDWPIKPRKRETRSSTSFVHQLNQLNLKRPKMTSILVIKDIGFSRSLTLFITRIKDKKLSFYLLLSFLNVSALVTSALPSSFTISQKKYLLYYLICFIF